MAIATDAMNVEQELENYFFPEDAPEEVPSEEVEVSSAAEEEDYEAEDMEASAEDEDVEVSEEEEDSDEPWMPRNLSELAEAMKVSEDDLKSIRLKTKVDGEEGEATLAEVIKNYQFERSLTKRNEAYLSEKQSFENHVAQQQRLFEEKLSSAEALTQALEEQLKGEIGNIDWEALEMDNPGQAALYRQKYMERIGSLEAAKQKVIKEREEQAQKQMEQYQKQMQQVLETNSQKLIDAIPEFRDPEVRKTEAEKLKTYLRSNGISDQEINSIVDYRVILMARKAMLHDEMETKAQPAKAKVKSKPKFTRPGSPKTKSNQEDTRVKRRYKRAADSQNTDDWAKVLEDRLF